MNNWQKLGIAFSGLAALAGFGLLVQAMFPSFFQRNQELEYLVREIETQAFESLSWGDDRDGLLLMDTQLGRVQRHIERYGSNAADLTRLRNNVCGSLNGAICATFSQPQYLSVLMDDYPNISAFCETDVEPEEPIACSN